MAFVSGAAPVTARRTARATCTMSSDESPAAHAVSRRAALLAGLGAVAAAAAPALAEIEYENVGFLGGGDVIDVNNANVRVYAKYPGMYPTLAGLIVSNGPYKSVEELYSLPGLTSSMKSTLDKYKNNLTALKPTPEYEIDKINNGLYR